MKFSSNLKTIQSKSAINVPTMPYLKTQEIAIISIGAALWGVLNAIFSPIVFQATGLPFLCDLIGFAVLTTVAWWVRKFGVLTVLAVVATIINFLLNPGGIFFLGFTVSSIAFDGMTRLAGYERAFKTPFYTLTTAVTLSTLAAAFAGLIIGRFFMSGLMFSSLNGILSWAGLHAIGGLIGGTIGGSLANMLRARRVFPKES